MMAVFLTTLVIGLGALAVQLLGGHESDVGGHDASHDTGGHDSPLMLLASIRFWAFALFAFGLVGTLLRLFNFAGRIESAVIATVAGLASGFVSATVMRRLQRQATTSSVVTTSDVVGRVGRVIVAPSTEARGKVRVSVHGSFIDYIARSDESLEADESVIVESCDDGEVRVSRAPKELILKE
jgi:membrane protein implicated in regulation of membrane protease activity